MGNAKQSERPEATNHSSSLAGPAGNLYKDDTVEQPKPLLPLEALPTKILFQRAKEQADLAIKNKAAAELFKRHTYLAQSYQAELLKQLLQAKNRVILLANYDIDFDEALQYAHNAELKILLLIAAVISGVKSPEVLFTQLTHFATKEETNPSHFNSKPSLKTPHAL